MKQSSGVVIVLNTKETRPEQYRQSICKGLDISRTSFLNLISGKKLESKGWVVV